MSLSLLSRIRAYLSIVLITLPIACGGGGGGGDGSSAESQAISTSLNDSLATQVQASGGYQLPADAPIDPQIKLVAPPPGVMPFAPGQSISNQLSFSAPAGVNVTGVGIRFGNSGPINVIPFSTLTRQENVTDSDIYRAAAKRARHLLSAETAVTQSSADVTDVEALVGSVGSDGCASIDANSTISGTGTWSLSTSGAANGSQPTACAFDDSNRDRWVRWQAPTSGTWTIGTCNSPDSDMDIVLTLWADNGACPSSPALGCDDDSCGDLWDASLSFTANAGSNYLIQFSNYDQDSPAWAGTFSIASGGAGGSNPGTGSYGFDVPVDICSNLSSICHQIICYEYAVTDIGTISAANIMQVAMQCGNCSEPSCQQLISDCEGGGASPYAGNWAGAFSGNCCPGDPFGGPVNGSWTFTVSQSGLVTGTVTSDGKTDTLSGSVSASGAFGSGTAAGASWGGTFTNNSVSGTWSAPDPDCSCSGAFSGSRQ